MNLIDPGVGLAAARRGVDGFRQIGELPFDGSEALFKLASHTCQLYHAGNDDAVKFSGLP